MSRPSPGPWYACPMGRVYSAHPNASPAPLAQFEGSNKAANAAQAALSSEAIELLWRMKEDLRLNLDRTDEETGDTYHDQVSKILNKLVNS